MDSMKPKPVDRIIEVTIASCVDGIKNNKFKMGTRQNAHQNNHDYESMNQVKQAMLAQEEEALGTYDDNEDDFITNSTSSESAGNVRRPKVLRYSTASDRRSDGKESGFFIEHNVMDRGIGDQVSRASRRPSAGYVAALTDMAAVAGDKSDPADERETWPNKFDFLVALTGYAVGFGNVWRFPYLCFKNGGGAFLIPYFTCALLAGVPVFFLEVAIGQFMSEGTITVWRMVPIFKGIGYGTIVIVTLLNIYYIVIMSWVLAYLFQSFTSPLPWERCDQWWNSPDCFSSSPFANMTANLTRAQIVQLKSQNRLTDSAEEYWNYAWKTRC